MQAFGLPGCCCRSRSRSSSVGGILVLLGFVHARRGALPLALFCVATAVLFHNKFGNRNELLHFEKDLAIAGGFLVLAARGGGAWALDAQPWRSSQSDATAMRVHAPSLPGRSQR